MVFERPEEGEEEGEGGGGSGPLRMAGMIQVVIVFREGGVGTKQSFFLK